MTRERAPIRVLVCDDVPALRRLYRRWLDHESDIELVGEAADGAEAIAMTDELVPDVVLLDIYLPVMSGLDALSEISLRHPDVKVILMTGLEPEQVEAMASQLGAADYITKGTHLDEVAERIRAAVSR
jgi:DNA-binding NarL/FixJ family response regulator